MTAPVPPGSFPIPPLLRRIAFGGYALALFIATHWPNLKVESDSIDRPDILVHLVAFAGWSFALLFSGLLKRESALSSAGLAWLCGAVYAAIDEALQAIPFIQRTAAIDDYVADLGGVTLGCLLWLVGAALRQRAITRQ